MTFPRMSLLLHALLLIGLSGAGDCKLIVPLDDGLTFTFTLELPVIGSPMISLGWDARL